ncbi:MAG: STAS domain-containing protein [Brevundimonas sp.]|uniref:STAS domain-containing protein n=1 Tax=Brevundimonas sp. TaxID=1871086 RepID=UPI00391A92CB
MTAVRLPAVLDIRAAGPLRDDLLALRGSDITLDGGEVERIGGLCLQVLISAKKTWAMDDKALTLAPVSEALTEQLAAYGCADLNIDLVGATG